MYLFRRVEEGWVMQGTGWVWVQLSGAS